ncbi:MAG: DUF3347 domain-containing protein [Ferruginibacter sp.]
MKKGLAIVALIVVALTAYYVIFRKRSSGPEIKPVPIALKKHSDAFNMRIDKMVNAYLSIKDAFVEDDTTSVKLHSKTLITLLDSIPVDEMKNDNASINESAKSSISDIRLNAVSLLSQTDITEMRQDFRMITEMMYPGFFKTINYEGPKLYLQNCPMAFGEDRPADWISNTIQVVNPYMGKHHPAYKSSMLHCGEVKDTIKAQ